MYFFNYLDDRLAERDFSTVIHFMNCLVHFQRYRCYWISPLIKAVSKSVGAGAIVTTVTIASQ